MVCRVNAASAKRQAGVLAALFALFFACAPLICVRLCQLRHREDLAVSHAAPFETTPAMAVAGHMAMPEHARAAAAEALASSQPRPSHGSPYLAEMQRLLQALVELVIVAGGAAWTLIVVSRRQPPQSLARRFDADTRYPPPRRAACFHAV